MHTTLAHWDVVVVLHRRPQTTTVHHPDNPIWPLLNHSPPERKTHTGVVIASQTNGRRTLARLPFLPVPPYSSSTLQSFTKTNHLTCNPYRNSPQFSPYSSSVAVIQPACSFPWLSLPAHLIRTSFQNRSRQWTRPNTHNPIPRATLQDILPLHCVLWPAHLLIPGYGTLSTP